MVRMIPESSENVPVTLISGFAGSGKSTVIEALRRAPGGDKLVIIQDNGEEDLIEILSEAANRVEDGGAIVVECAPALEPYPIVEFFEENPLPEGIRIDALVTVVDGSRFMTDVFTSRDMESTGLAIDEGDDRSVSEVMIEQVEFADVIIVNKMDLINSADFSVLDSLMERLNPHAKRLHATRGAVAPKDVVRTELFHLEETDAGAGWLAELDGAFDEIGEVEGVSSFTYLEHRPFHPERFAEILTEFGFPGLVRAKGSVWIATRHNEIGLWTLAGRTSLITSAGHWFAATPASEWPSSEADRLEIMQDWVPPFGDRRQEIAFIGIDLPEQEIRSALDSCLLTHQEMRDGPESWSTLADPLPEW